MGSDEADCCGLRGSPAQEGKDVSPKLEEAGTERLPLRRNEVINAGAGDEKPLEIVGIMLAPPEMRSNLRVCVRTFSPTFFG